MKKINIRSILLLILLLAGIGATAIFVSQRGGGRFELRQRASTPSGTVSMVMDTQTTDRYVGDIFPVKIMMNTGPEIVSGAAFRLFYPYTGTVPELEVVDEDPAVAGVQIKSNAAELGLTTNVNQVTVNKDGKVYIEFSATTVAVTGYSSGGDAKLLATIRFKVNKAGSKTIEHDPIISQITRKSDGKDVLLTIPAKTFNFAADTIAPTVTINQGPADGSTVTSSSVTLNWSAVDGPTRPSDAVSLIKYVYRFNAVAFQTTYDEKRTSVTQALLHGKNTFEVKGQDVSLNTSVPTAPGSKRTFTVDLTPKIMTISIDHASTGIPITINGTNFGALKQSVKFGTVAVAAANITSWTDTQIVARVPANADGDITVSRTVTTTAATSVTLVSNKVAFTLDTVLKLVFAYQGITADKGNKKVTVVVKKGTYADKQENLDAVWDTTQSGYTVTTRPLTRPFTTATTYTVSVVDNAHLRRRFSNVSLTLGNVNVITKKAAADNLIVADFNADNKLTLEDFGLLMSKVTSLTVPVTSAELGRFDLNADGILDITDVGLLLSNYTALEKLGDAE